MAEKTKAQLLKENKALQEQLNDKNDEIEQLKSAGSDASMNAQIEEQKQIIAELTDQLADKEKEAEVGGVVVKVGKDQYKILGNVRVGNDVFTAKELAENADVVNKLIKAGSGILVKLEEE